MIFKVSRRVVLGLIVVSLVVVSVLGLFQLIQTLPKNNISNPSGLVALCSSPLIAGTTVNNGTSGGHESFVTAYSCNSPINPPNSPTSTSQGVMNVATSGTYTPFFIIDTSNSTATVTSVQLTLNAQSVQGGATFCNTNVPVIPLTSGTGVALLTTYPCQNGSTPATTNTLWYTVTIVASTFGNISVGQITVSWQ